MYIVKEKCHFKKEVKKMNRTKRILSFSLILILLLGVNGFAAVGAPNEINAAPKSDCGY